MTQQGPDWIGSHVRALEYLRRRARGRGPATSSRAGSPSPAATSPASSGPTRRWPRHYGTTMLPARPGKPRDKAKVEVGVQVAERWILARLRNQTFFSPPRAQRAHRRAARGAQRPPDARLRGQPPASSSSGSTARRSRPLPAESLRLRRVEEGHASTSTTTSPSRSHFYSVPHAARCRDSVEVRATESTVEIYPQGQAGRRRTRAVTSRAVTPPCPSTCPAHTASTRSGRPRG